jgi:enoyl-CoA hydratase/carnithine racemase
MTDHVLYEQEGDIVVLTLNRAEQRNPISDDGMVEAIVAVLERVNADPSVRVAILTGAGTAFSSGGNVKRMAEVAEQRRTNPLATRGYYKTGIQRIPLMFETMDLPIIAAVNGPAIGAGNDLACMCDIRIAAESAKFAESFVKVGLIPGDGGAYLLPRVVGFSKACEMAFTGDQLDAQQALACGLVSQVVPDAELMDAARKLAKRIAANPPQAVRLTKRLMREGQHNRLDTLLELSAVMQSLAQTTDDHREAANAFVEKRRPKFTGR